MSRRSRVRALLALTLFCLFASFFFWVHLTGLEPAFSCRESLPLTSKPGTIDKGMCKIHMVMKSNDRYTVRPERGSVCSSVVSRCGIRSALIHQSETAQQLALPWWQTSGIPLLIDLQYLSAASCASLVLLMVYMFQQMCCDGQAEQATKRERTKCIKTLSDSSRSCIASQKRGK
jgi:hypothetical protein